MKLLKKIFIYLILNFFTFSVSAEDLIMKCGKNTYKYIQDPSGDKVVWKHPQATANKYKEWCTNEPNKKWGLVSIDGWTRIIKDNKATCLIKKATFKKDGKTTIRSNSVSVSDFINLTRYTEWYHTNTGNKKNIKEFKCKKRKK